MAEEPKEQDQKELSPEEIEKMQEDSMKFYKRQIEVITPQVEYQRLATDLEELKTRRMVTIMQRASMMQPPPDQEFPEDQEDDDPTGGREQETGPEQPGEINNEEKPRRKLKTE